MFVPHTSKEMSIKVFISYAHVDRDLHKKLEDHLSSLKYSREITIWQDQEIPLGANWKDQINTHLNEAHLILLLVSASFISSDYCWNKEVLAALERHKAGAVRVVPIILKPVHWQSTPLGQLQALPSDARPITLWDDQDAALEDVVRGIQNLLEELRTFFQKEAPGSESEVPFEGRKAALIVGVNNTYRSSLLPDLKFAEDDAHEIASILRTSACNFLCHQMALTGEKAETHIVRRAVFKLAQQRSKQDLLLFYFLGHALLMRAGEGHTDIYLVTYDFDMEEAVEDTTAYISLRWLRKQLYHPDSAARVLIILDCCYMENVVHANSHDSSIDVSQLLKECLGHSSIVEQNGRWLVVLTARMYTTPIQERMMTYPLRSALQGAVREAANQQGYITLPSLYSYLQTQMSQEQLPDLPGDFPQTCILAYHPHLSDDYRLEVLQAEKDTLRADVSKLSDQLSEVHSLITEGDFFKRWEEIANKNHLLPFDYTPCRGASLADINMEAVANLSQKERVQNQPDIHSATTDQGLLEHFNLLHKEEEGVVLTYGAVLCFGKKASKWSAEAFTRCTSYRGNNRLEALDEDKHFHGSLLEQYESSLEFLRRNLRLSRVIGTQGSVEQWEIPLVALREALANALIHREYANQTNCVHVEIFYNRVEISNPGGLPGTLTLQQLGSANHYPLRNPQIAHIFYLYNYVEKLGTGIARMRRVMREARLPEPRFDTNSSEGVKVELRRPQHTNIHEKAASPSLLLLKAIDSKQGYRFISIVLAAILAITFLPSAFSGLFAPFSTLPTMGIGTSIASDGELIGLSDGRYTFDTATDRLDVSLKVAASHDLAQGNRAEAELRWIQSVAMDTSDAEGLIYLEDQRVLDSGSPYITLVVGAILTGNASDISSGRNNLQGAYVAQKEYNDGRKLSGDRKVRLLIANAGSSSDNVAQVTEQIVQAAQQNATIIGVMGWSRSAYVQNSIPVLTHAHIPMVSPTASADILSGISSYFFRVAPPNRTQAIAGAKYAEQELHASRVALFVDPKNSYSENLADDFQKQFVADGNQIVDTENYTVGDKARLPINLQNALKAKPDLIYFAGYIDDLAVLLVNLPTSLPNLQVLGGDALYSPSGYPLSVRPSFSRLRFTSFAYFGEWDILGMNKPQFFSEYPTYFNPLNADDSANPYGFTRADYVVMLSYDAMFALLQGCQNVLLTKDKLTATALQHGLTQITGAKAFQGVSGQISFDSNGDPIDKAVVILSASQNGYIQILGVQGCFVLGPCQ